MKTQLKMYSLLGFKLVALNGKAPISKRWNQKRKSEKIKKGQNLGIKLSYSGLCCFDIDDLKQFKKISKVGGYWKLIKKGIHYTSGKDNRLKILFRTKPLPSIPLGFNCGEFRCASKTGLTMQDVLPPSLHPEGTTYRWVSHEFKNWVPFNESPPTIPKLPKKLSRMIMSYHTKKFASSNTHKALYVDVFNKYVDDISIDSLIAEIGGYTPVLGGWRRIGSTNRLAIKVYANDAYNFSTDEEQKIRHGPLDLYNLFVIARFDGNEKKARQWVCNELRREVDDVYKTMDTEYKVEILG